MSKTIHVLVSDAKTEIADIRKRLTELCRVLDRIEASDVAAESAEARVDAEARGLAVRYEQYLIDVSNPGWVYPNEFWAVAGASKRKVDAARAWLDKASLLEENENKQIRIIKGHKADTIRRNAASLQGVLAVSKCSLTSAAARAKLGFDGARWNRALTYARMHGHVEVERQGPAKVLRLVKSAR